MNEFDLPKACANCKHFGILHPLVTEMQTKSREEQLAFIQQNIQTSGYCLRTKVVNPLTGQLEHRLAFYERMKQQYKSILELTEHCDEDAKFFEPIQKPEE